MVPEAYTFVPSAQIKVADPRAGIVTDVTDEPVAVQYIVSEAFFVTVRALEPLLMTVTHCPAVIFGSVALPSIA